MCNVMLRRLAPVLLFLLLGTGLALLVVPKELEQMHWEVPGMPESYPLEQMMRPILLLILCYIPLLGAIIYACMGTMSRYMTRGFLTYFFLCTGILLMIYILADFTDNMERFNSRFENPLPQILSFYGTQLPMFLYQILPYTLLMGTLWCLSRLCATSELTGMLQSGRSLMRVCVPIFIYGGLVSLVYGICGFHWAPNGALYRQIALKQDRTSQGEPVPIIYRNDATDRIWRITDPASIEAPGEPMRDVVIEQFDPQQQGRLVYQLRAESAQWNKSDATWIFYNAYQRNVISFDDASNFAESQPQNDSFSPSLTKDFAEKPYQIISPSSSGGNDSIGTSALYEFLASESGSKQVRAQLRTEWHLRIARIFTCMVLILIAIPNAITFQRRSAMKGIGLALLMAALLLFFYRVFPTLGESGILPAWLSAWVTNIVYTLVAAWLFNKNLAHRSVGEWLQSLGK